MAGRLVVKNVCLGDNGSWAVISIFEVRISVSLEGVQQVLLNTNGTLVLVKNGPSVTLHKLRSSPISQEPVTLKLPDTKWINHPTDPKFVLACSLNCVSIYARNDLSEITVIGIERPRLFWTPDPDSSPENRVIVTDCDGPVVKVNRACANSSGSHLLVHTAIMSNDLEEHLTSLLETPAILPPSALTPHPSTVTPIPIPAEIQRQIEIPLGILPSKRLIFLDRDYWMCSWRLGANLTTEEVQRHYFLPKDWLNAECLELCALLADGRLLIPNNGELAIIKSAGISHW